ncbi:MAG: ATP-binding protein [Candidatus Parabeggiatoa sp. nov. 3]|nr:MAG: ATP-binding protein [Gammaproteobacteria bacterium]RKZ57893.1 MAG: ATP-binding protein [Gammaproteobacteria bacterium]RKZ82325.1 MAG: ATP-binding protein [Gammaproteobacteria bacterium]
MCVNMLKVIKIDNFKSLKKTEITLSKNSFLIGMNGAGKTTFLQLIDFLSVISLGKMEEWLEKREWRKKELTFYGSNKFLIDIEVTFQLGQETYIWDMAFNSQNLKCTKERIYQQSGETYRPILSVNGGEYRFYTQSKEKINFKYNGSILSALESDLLGDELNSIHKFFSEIRSAELLSPVLMKKRAREAKNEIGLGGEKLSAFLNALSRDKKEQLQKTLNRFFPDIDSFETSSLPSGWKKLSVVEKHNSGLIETDSLHLSDGVLRILAILSQLLTTESILIFDEIEDGINQEFVEKLVETLLNSHHQTIVATHSPLLLNYLDDHIAKKSILFVYKAQDGSTKMDNFFELIAKHQKISDHEYDLFGPGEIMQRVNLLELTQKRLFEANHEDSD